MSTNEYKPDTVSRPSETLDELGDGWATPSPGYWHNRMRKYEDWAEGKIAALEKENEEMRAAIRAFVEEFEVRHDDNYLGTTIKFVAFQQIIGYPVYDARAKALKRLFDLSVTGTLTAEDTNKREFLAIDQVSQEKQNER